MNAVKTDSKLKEAAIKKRIDPKTIREVFPDQELNPKIANKIFRNNKTMRADVHDIFKREGERKVDYLRDLRMRVDEVDDDLMEELA